MRGSSASQILIQVRGALLKYVEYPADKGGQPSERCLLRRGGRSEAVSSCLQLYGGHRVELVLVWVRD